MLFRSQLRCSRNFDTLYPVEVISSTNEDRVKIHYVGYSTRYDEWRPRRDVIHLVETPIPQADEEFSLHKELAVRIKSSLLSRRRSSPDVKIEITFDKNLYCKGLGNAGYVTCVKQGVEHRSIDSYSDLDGILGKGWHYRGLNDCGDFCYAIENTIDFYLHKKKRLIQYIPADDGTPSRVPIATGYILVFKFIRGDGIGSQFGKLSSVFK